MNKVVVITGPTASGKSKVAIDVALAIGGEIINADSMQIYKRCDIGSAKPDSDDLKKVPHHLISFVETDSDFSVADYKLIAERKIDEIFAAGKIPVITGGTGMYIESLLENFEYENHEENIESRKKYKEVLDSKGKKHLYDLLQKRDPEASEGLHENNTRRVIRYLEILDGFEGTLAEYMKNSKKTPSKFEFNIFVLMPERDELYKRIESRVDLMIKEGLVEEVRGLLDSGVSARSQAMQGIGYKETAMYLQGYLNFEEYKRILKRNTRRYAKRQFTWCRRYKNSVKILPEHLKDPRTTTEYILDNL